MVNILIVTHGKFGGEILKSAEMIIGKQENVTTISFMPENSLDDLICEVKRNVTSIGEHEELLILVDIMGGSPFNSILHLTAQYELQCIAGFNLPILIEVLLNRDVLNPSKLKHHCLKQCAESIVDATSIFNK